MKTMERVNILGVNVTVTDLPGALSAVEAEKAALNGRYICVCNVHTTVMAHDDPAMLAAENGAALVLPDGGPLSVVQRRRGYVNAARVTGPDFMEAVLARSGKTGWRHYFYGSTEQTQRALFAALTERYPGLHIAGGRASAFRPLTEAENQEILDEIDAVRADFVWVGLGAPRQELWMAENAGKTHALMVGVGGAFDVFSGNVKRAPDWMQRCCLEWLFRLLQEPRRLFKRYFVTNTRFLWLLFKERGR